MKGSLLFLLACVVVVVVCDSSNSASDKIHQFIHQHYETHAATEEISTLLFLTEEADVEAAVAGVPFKERGQVVYDILTQTAARSQPAIIKMLEKLHLNYKAYWLTNMIVVQANYHTLFTIAEHAGIMDIHPNFEYKVQLPTPDFTAEAEAPEAVEWNVARVKAPEVWLAGFNGKGFTVAVADTGIQWNHPALIQQYRGYVDANTVAHDYHWWDAVNGTGSRCGAKSPVPCDDNGHGTHTTGTAAGTDHGANQIGVAPGAKWIGCRNMNAGAGTPQLYIDCLQFFVAPTDLKGGNADPSRRPHVIGNSYGCTAGEGCVAGSLRNVINNVHAAGIFMSVSAGNSGPSCSTVNEPPAIYPNVFSVGALAYNSATIASYSSRGPVTVDGSNVQKPEISAPGSSVRSSYPTNSYASLSGTSMASPHITGIIALLWQARPELERDIAATIKALTSTAIPRAATTCGGTGGQNNVYGFGEVDVLAATKYVSLFNNSKY